MFWQDRPDNEKEEYLMLSKIGTMEIVVILAVVLLIFGPKMLPRIGKSIGKTIGGFKRGLQDESEIEEDITVKKSNIPKTAAAAVEKDES
jgi:sec-independent protein translocase protein TatA